MMVGFLGPRLVAARAVHVAVCSFNPNDPFCGFHILLPVLLDCGLSSSLELGFWFGEVSWFVCTRGSFFVESGLSAGWWICQKVFWGFCFYNEFFFFGWKVKTEEWIFRGFNFCCLVWRGGIFSMQNEFFVTLETLFISSPWESAFGKKIEENSSWSEMKTGKCQVGSGNKGRLINFGIYFLFFFSVENSHLEHALRHFHTWKMWGSFKFGALLGILLGEWWRKGIFF